MRKYDPLTTFLITSNRKELTLTYNDIEKILGSKLPRSSRDDKRWWMNNDSTHVQSAAWGKAGYEVKSYSLGYSVTLIKK